MVNKKFPKGIDEQALETYLSDDEFQKVFEILPINTKNTIVALFIEKLNDIYQHHQTMKHNIKNEMKPNDIIITFGIGLGYLLDETFNTFSNASSDAFNTLLIVFLLSP